MPRRAKRGLPFLTLSIASIIAGSGLVFLPPVLASQGKISLLALGLAGIGISVIALCFAQLGSSLPHQSEDISYNYLVTSSLPAFTGVMSTFLNFVILATAASFMCRWIADYIVMHLTIPYAVVHLVVILSVTLPFIILTKYKNVLLLVSQYSTFLIKLMLLGIVVFANIFYFKSERVLFSRGDITQALGNLSLVASLVKMSIFSLTGCEAGFNLAPIARHPRKDLPRAILLGTMLAAATYFYITLILMGSLDASSNILRLNVVSGLLSQTYIPSWAGTAVHLALGACVFFAGITMVYSFTQEVHRSFSTRFDDYAALVILILLQLLSSSTVINLNVKAVCLQYLLVTTACGYKMFKLKKGALALVPSIVGSALALCMILV